MSNAGRQPIPVSQIEQVRMRTCVQRECLRPSANVDRRSPYSGGGPSTIDTPPTARLHRIGISVA
jgi:hypothetical protein